MKAYEKNLTKTNQNESEWEQTLIYEDGNKTMILTETVRNVSNNGTSSRKRSLNATEIDGKQALLNSENNGTMAVRVVNG